LKGLRKKNELFRRAGAQIVTVSSDPVDELDKYRGKNSVPFMMLSDSSRNVIKEYGVYNASERDGIAIPAVFIVDKEGVTRYSSVGGTLVRARSGKLLKVVRSL
jgi:peroxiredoxin Q/BCP